MTPTHAIAESERPPNRPFAAVGRVHSRRAVLCYESFTLKTLLERGLPRTFARVMTGRKPTSHTATAGVFPLRARRQQSSPPRCVGTQVALSDLWPLPTDYRQL